MRAKELFQTNATSGNIDPPAEPKPAYTVKKDRHPLDKGKGIGHNPYRENFLDKEFSNTEEVPMTVPADIQGIPDATLRRLPTYGHLLRRLAQQNQEFVSCTQIGGALHLDPTQVRKDLAVTGVIGRPKVGYKVLELCEKVEDFLGWTNTQDAVLIGVGSLGTALLGYKPFADNGVRIVAAFDTDAAKVDEMVHETPVFPLEKLPNLVERMKIHVGIVTVPVENAQTVCDLLVLSGIRAIWNFAPTALHVPDGVIVQNENLFSSLAILSSKLAAALRTPAGRGIENEE